jgi:hypothetical protein
MLSSLFFLCAVLPAGVRARKDPPGTVPVIACQLDARDYHSHV